MTKVERRQKEVLFIDKRMRSILLFVLSQIGFGGRIVSGVALSVWKNGETIMAAVVDRGQKVRRKRTKDQD